MDKAIVPIGITIPTNHIHILRKLAIVDSFQRNEILCGMTFRHKIRRYRDIRGSFPNRDNLIQIKINGLISDESFPIQIHPMNFMFS